VDDARRGCEFVVLVILRLPGAGKAEEVLVSRYVPLKSVPTNSRLSVEGKQMHLLIPLSALGLRKGQEIRLVPVAPGRDVVVEQTLTLG
jgi:hypothetical protein